jgi:transcriptional regulator
MNIKRLSKIYKERCFKLRTEGLTASQIAERMGTTKACIDRMFWRWKEELIKYKEKQNEANDK